MTVRWLDAEEMRAWRAYVETVFELNAALEADLAEHGLTLGDYQVLVFLSEADGRAMRMCDLAARLQLSPSGLTRRLDGLVRAGVVERRPSETDRRVMLAVLTPHGAAAARRGGADARRQRAGADLRSDRASATSPRWSACSPPSTTACTPRRQLR